MLDVCPKSYRSENNMNIRNDNERLLGAFYGIVRSVLNNDTQFSGSVEAIIEKLPKEPCPDQEVGLVSEIISRAECLCELPFLRKDVRYDVSQSRGEATEKGRCVY